MDWNTIQENWDWLGHIVEALGIMIVVAALQAWVVGWRLALFAGCAFAAGHFHGREKRDHEVSVHMLPPHLDGYYFWNWNWDQTTDFWPTAAVMTTIGFAIGWRRLFGVPRSTRWPL